MNAPQSSGTRFLHYAIIAKGILALVLLAVCLVIPDRVASAIEPPPPGLFDATPTTLENGFRVILIPRRETRTVSMRLAVDVGHWDFPCGRQQTAHLLEHLLFTGTTEHEEAELDAIIESHGGTWNAKTRNEETVYEIDMPGPYTDVALDVLYEIMSKSVISEDDVELSRQVVHRELGGRPSIVHRWLYRLGYGKNVWPIMWKAIGLRTDVGCQTMETPDGITRAQLLYAYKTYYVPTNMVLVVVGDFDSSEMLKRTRATFGQLPPRRALAREPIKPSPSNAQTVVESHSRKILAEGAVVVLAYPVPERASDDWPAVRVMGAYLNKHTYNALRVDRGLAYSPGAGAISFRDFGLMLTYADLDIENLNTAVETMQSVIETVSLGRLDDDEIEELKRGVLISEFWKLERNSEIADYYVGARHSLSAGRRIADDIIRISEVKAKDLARVAKQYLRPRDAVVIEGLPTLTYNELGLWTAGIPATVLLWAVYRWRRRVRLRRTHVDFRL